MVAPSSPRSSFVFVNVALAPASTDTKKVFTLSSGSILISTPNGLNGPLGPAGRINCQEVEAIPQKVILQYSNKRDVFFSMS